MPRECGLGKSVRTRNITNVKSIYHRVCYCGFGLEIQRCFFRIKALAKLEGQGQRPVWPEAKNFQFSSGNTVWENAPWLLSVCVCALSFILEYFLKFLKANYKTKLCLHFRSRPEQSLLSLPPPTTSSLSFSSPPPRLSLLLDALSESAHPGATARP